MATAVPDNTQLHLFPIHATPLMRAALTVAADIDELKREADLLRAEGKPMTPLLERIRRILPGLTALGIARTERSLRAQWQAHMRAERRRPGDFGDGEIPFESFAVDTLCADNERVQKLAEGKAENAATAERMVLSEIESLRDALQRAMRAKAR